MKKTTYIIWMIVLCFLFALIAPYFLYILKVIFVPKNGGYFGQEKYFFWSFVGVMAYAISRFLIKSKSRFLETFSHEATHTLVAFLFRRKVHSFHVEDSGSGMIFTSGNNNYSLIPVALAPYNLPICTYLLLSIRFLINDNGLWLYDILVGITICFHFYCFKTQIGNHQTDINQYPLSFSYTYILVSWIINLCIILPSFFPNMNGDETASPPIYYYGVWSCMSRLVTECWNNLICYFNLIGLWS